jgi:hypothetical protein
VYRHQGHSGHHPRHTLNLRAKAHGTLQPFLHLECGGTQGRHRRRLHQGTLCEQNALADHGSIQQRLERRTTGTNGIDEWLAEPTAITVAAR